MMFITVDGIVNNVKKYENEDGSVKLLFSISSRTIDYSRREDKKARDYWGVDLWVPSSRKRVIDHIFDGKIMSIGGIPYQQKNDGKDYVSIKANVDYLEFRGEVTKKNDSPEASSSSSEQKEKGQEEKSNKW